MSRALTRCICSLVLVLTAGADASQAAAVKPSALVTVVSYYNSCPGGSGYVFDTQVKSDGSSTPFTIPAKSVLVVTDFSFVFHGGPSGTSGNVELLLADPSSPGSFSRVAEGSAPLPAGLGGATIQFPTGFAVKAGSTLCVQSLVGGLPTATVHGYLTKDK